MVGKQQLIHSATDRMCQLNWTADAAELKSPFLSLTNGLAVVHPHYGYWLLLYYMLIRRRRRNGIRRQHLQNSATIKINAMLSNCRVSLSTNSPQKPKNDNNCILYRSGSADNVHQPSLHFPRTSMVHQPVLIFSTCCSHYLPSRIVIFISPVLD